MNNHCGICNRALDKENDPLSADCGGDCWGCIGEQEAEMGGEQSIAMLRQEFKDGLRDAWLPSPTVTTISKVPSVEIRLENPLGDPCKHQEFAVLLYKDSLFGRKRIYVNEQAVTDENGIFTIKIKNPKQLNNSLCKIQRGNTSWFCPVTSI